MGQLHGRLRLRIRRGGRDALIEHHHDIAADGLLHFNARLGRQQIALAIDIALEVCAGFIHGSRMGQGENLKAAGVRQHRARPIHEAVNAAELLEDLGARPKQEMIGIRQQQARAGCLQTFHGLRFDRRLGAHRHEDRRLDCAVQRLKSCRARLGTGRFGFQSELQSGVIVR